jgi:hypothetical protein
VRVAPSSRHVAHVRGDGAQDLVFSPSAGRHPAHPVLEVKCAIPRSFHPAATAGGSAGNVQTPATSPPPTTRQEPPLLKTTSQAPWHCPLVPAQPKMAQSGLLIEGRTSVVTLYGQDPPVPLSPGPYRVLARATWRAATASGDNEEEGAVVVVGRVPWVREGNGHDGGGRRRACGCRGAEARLLRADENRTSHQRETHEDARHDHRPCRARDLATHIAGSEVDYSHDNDDGSCEHRDPETYSDSKERVLLDLHGLRDPESKDEQAK